MVEGAALQRADVAAVPQHGDHVRQVHDLVQPMRNVEDAHPVRLQPLNQGEQRVLLAPTQRGGGLVQDQHLGVEGNRSGDLHHLPFANTELAAFREDGAVEVEPA